MIKWSISGMVKGITHHIEYTKDYVNFYLNWNNPKIFESKDFKLLYYIVKVKECGVEGNMGNDVILVYEETTEVPKFGIENHLVRQKSYTVEVTTLFQDFDKDEPEESKKTNMDIITSNCNYELIVAYLTKRILFPFFIILLQCLCFRTKSSK